MDNPSMKDIEKLLRNSKYIVATTNLWNDDKKRAKDVALMGFSNKVRYEECFDTWNTGFANFFYGVRVTNGKVVDEEDRILEVTYIADNSRKTVNEKIRASRRGMNGI